MQARWTVVEPGGADRCRKCVEHVEGRPLDDAELIERARRGDMAAYAELVRRYQGPALRTAALLAADSTEAEDAVQDAFVKAHRALARFREGAPFRPWLLRIVANEARNRRRSAGRRQGLALRIAEDRPSSDAAPSPEAAVLAHETREALLAAIGRLEPDDRLVLAYRYFMDLSEAEMAAALGVARGTVKSRLSRALARLRLALPESPR
jgi:RNA polymerase sigma factor (sigma-70 family)